MEFNGITNFYGTLTVYEEDGRYYWMIEDYCTEVSRQEIPQYLYESLARFHCEQNTNTHQDLPPEYDSIPHIAPVKAGDGAGRQSG
jgi:hypothetical protein